MPGQSFIDHVYLLPSGEVVVISEKGTEVFSIPDFILFSGDQPFANLPLGRPQEPLRRIPFASTGSYSQTLQYALATSGKPYISQWPGANLEIVMPSAAVDTLITLVLNADVVPPTKVFLGKYWGFQQKGPGTASALTYYTTEMENATEWTAVERTFPVENDWGVPKHFDEQSGRLVTHPHRPIVRNVPPGPTLPFAPAGWKDNQELVAVVVKFV